MPPPKALCSKDTTPTLFAFGKLYCFAVIFGLRPSDIRYASFRRRIEYHCKAKPCNITFATAKTSRCRRQHITKNYQEVRTYSPQKWWCNRKEPIRNKIHTGFFTVLQHPTLFLRFLFFINITNKCNPIIIKSCKNFKINL